MNSCIATPAELETTYEAKRKGFLEIALRKSREALPYIDQAKALKANAARCKQANDLLSDLLIAGPLAEAAGVSTKAAAFLKAEDIEGIVAEFIKNYLEPAGSNFLEELTYRFLLSKGDALGGRMRNIVGALAGEKFSRFISAQLRNGQFEHEYLLNGISTWLSPDKITADDLISIKAIRWKKEGDTLRELIYNSKVPVVGQNGNNIDVSIFRNQPSRLKSKESKKQFIEDPHNYLALGELKGGIDPAGADEHWKTANTALQRIRTSFKNKACPVQTFFVGGAIEASMAEEIFRQLQTGELAEAANLTNEPQLSALCAWIVQL